MKTMTFEFTDEQVLTLVTALGVLKDRIGQKGRWLQRKRLPMLSNKLADYLALGNEEEAERLRQVIGGTQRDVDSRIKRGEMIADLMNRIKQLSGITDERLQSFKIPAEGGVITDYGTALEDQRRGWHGRPEASYTAGGLREPYSGPHGAPWLDGAEPCASVPLEAPSTAQRSYRRPRAA